MLIVAMSNSHFKPPQNDEWTRKCNYATAFLRAIPSAYVCPTTGITQSITVLNLPRPLVPLHPLVLVGGTEGNASEELRPIKIHIELIPKWTKWVSILQNKENCSTATAPPCVNQQFLTESLTLELKSVRRRRNWMDWSAAITVLQRGSNHS